MKTVEDDVTQLLVARDIDALVLLNMDIFVDEFVPTACLRKNGERYQIHLNKNWYPNLNQSERKAILKHEVHHLTHRHPFRFGDRQHDIWNIACDMAINQDIRGLPANGITLPIGWPVHESAEFYYNMLVKNATKIKVAVEYTSDMIPMSPEAEDEVREFIKNAIKTGVGNGFSIGSHMREYAAELNVTPVVNWRDAIRRFVATMTSGHRATLKKEDRREASVFGKTKVRLPSIALCIDSSGSISDALLNKFMGNIIVLQKVIKEVFVIVADDRVEEHFKFTGHEKLRCRGRGGTDFNPAIEYINKKLPNIDGVVYLTDGICEAPKVRCKRPVLWLITENMELEVSPKVRIQE